MRIYVENYAYEIRQERDPLTQLIKSWQYLIYLVRPKDEVVTKGFKETQADAEREAKLIVERLEKEVAAFEIA